VPRINGLESRQAGWLTRLFYWFTRRKVGRVVEPIKLTAHQPRLLWAVGKMELAQEAAASIDPALKWLVKLRAAALIGCPY
jgi:hypothetical protein